MLLQLTNESLIILIIAILPLLIVSISKEPLRNFDIIVMFLLNTLEQTFIY